ncbi:MAG: YceI family protein [Crocinitomicaceae bacterium]|nr:YceI family protein [Crocinitomicaceae bacterium]
MKNLFLSIFILCNVCFTYAQNLKFNLQKAEVGFYFHGDKVNGSLSGLTADIQINLSDLTQTKVKGAVDVTTIKTGISMRDKHLISSDFFDAKAHPKMTFVSKAIEVKDDILYIEGLLTIKATTRKETFQLSIKDGEIVFTGRINTADYDVMTKKNRAKTEVDITINIPTV